MSGKFIVIEGVRGSGKSTLIKEIQKHADICAVEDFGVFDFCAQMRESFLNPGVPWGSRLAMAIASKVYLQEKMIKSLLEAGKDVLCERWTPSIEAYLLYPNDLSPDLVEDAIRLFGIIEPDLTVVCSVDREVAIERVRASGRKDDLFEEKGDEFMRKVCTYYNSICNGVQADSTETRLDIVLRELGLRGEG